MSFERPTWPNDAHCAISLTFDNFGESYDLLRYGHAGGANADGVYAPRRGVERILELLATHSIQATFFVEGWNVQKYPDLARRIVDAGHEIGAHGWMHERWSALDESTERELIRRTTGTIADVIGRRPTGWRAPAGLTTVNTLRLLHEAGYRYDSSFGDEDIPYLIKTSAEGEDEIVELPWSWALDDAAYYAYPGTIRNPADVVDLWIDEFDAACVMTGNFMLVCHPRYSGRPTRLRALDQIVQFMLAHDGVWFARCDEIAQHVASSGTTPHYPFPARMPDDERSPE